MFDPYSRFLGLPEGQRPPTHYELLGLAPGQRDPRAVEEAALLRASQARRHQLARPEEASRLLNEIARAAATLADPLTREAYDAGLGHAQTGPAPLPPEAALQLARHAAGAPGGACRVWVVRLRQVRLTGEQQTALRGRFHSGEGAKGRRARVWRRKEGAARSSLVLAVVDGPG